MRASSVGQCEDTTRRKTFHLVNLFSTWDRHKDREETKKIGAEIQVLGSTRSPFASCHLPRDRFDFPVSKPPAARQLARPLCARMLGRTESRRSLPFPRVFVNSSFAAYLQYFNN